MSSDGPRRYGDISPRTNYFWQRHIVPLTFRAYNPENYFLRPGVARPLLDLANAHYAVAHHLGYCLEWVGRVRAIKSRRKQGRREFPTSTEAVYAFFAHAMSAVDASLWLVCRANDVLDRYGRGQACRPRFSNTRCWGKQFPIGLRQDHRAPCLDPFFQLNKVLKPYRNLLLHETPVFIHNDRMPKDSAFSGYAGLAGIGMLARDPGAFPRDFEEVEHRLTELVALLGRGLTPVWCRVLNALDSIADPRYHRDQLALAAADKKLKLADFERVRGFGFCSGH